MKIRIKGNSIRLRLTKTEVAAFCQTGRVEEQTFFSNRVFTYALQSKQDLNTLDAEFKGDNLTLFVDEEKSKDWHETNLVGFNEVVQRPDGSELALLIEKDFACLDNREEDQSDNYSNPKAGPTES